MVRQYVDPLRKFVTDELTFRQQLEKDPDSLIPLLYWYFPDRFEGGDVLTVAELYERAVNLPSAMIPEDRTIFPELLFLGQENLKGLGNLAHEGVAEFQRALYFPGSLADYLHKSIDFTVRAYKLIGAKRRSGEPYAAHPLRVFIRQLAGIGASLAVSITHRQGIDIGQDSFGRNLAVLSASDALFHDLPEDQQKWGYTFFPFVGGLCLKKGLRYTLFNNSQLTHQEQAIRDVGLIFLEKFREKVNPTTTDLTTALNQIYLVQASTQINDYLDLQNIPQIEQKYVDLFRFYLHLLKGGADRLDNLSINFERDGRQYTPVSLDRALKIILLTEYYFGKLLSPAAIRLPSPAPDWLGCGYDPILDYFDPTLISWLYICFLIRDQRQIGFNGVWQRHEMKFSENGTPFVLYLPRPKSDPKHQDPCLDPNQMGNFGFINSAFRRQRQGLPLSM